MHTIAQYEDDDAEEEEQRPEVTLDIGGGQQITQRGMVRPARGAG